MATGGSLRLPVMGASLDRWQAPTISASEIANPSFAFMDFNCMTTPFVLTQRAPDWLRVSSGDM
jgi:hypothetical protein